MTERRRDPLELWVGTWTPEEWIERENRRRDDTTSEMTAPEPSPAGEPPKAE